MGVIIGCIGAVTKALAVAGLAVEGLKTIVGALTNIAKALGIIRPEQDMAEKALQAEQAGIKPENYDTYEEYLKDVGSFETDPEKEHTDAEKLSKEIELLSGMITEKNPDIPVEFMISVVAGNPGFLSEVRMSEIAKECGGNADMLKNVLGLISGSEKNVEKLDSAEKMLLGVEKKLDPALSDSQALRNIYSNI